MSGCFDLVLVRLAIGTTFQTEYRITGFFLSGHWLNPFRVEPVVGILMAVVGFLHVVFLIQPLFFTPFNILADWRRLPSPAWFYAYFRAFLRNYWLGTLGLAVGAIVTTGLSSFSVWLLFLHAWFEGWLFSLRLSAYLRVENTALPILLPPLTFMVLGLTVMMASDSPIDKAIITLVPAFVSDMGNLVVSSLLLHRARAEDASAGVDVIARHGMTAWDHGSELIFVVMHFLLFYPQLGLACLMTTFDLAILLLFLFLIHTAVLCYVNCTQASVPVQEQHKPAASPFASIP